VSRHLSIGLSWGGVTVLAMFLAGCSTAGQPDATSSITGTAPALASGTNGASGTAQTGAPGSQTVALGSAVTLADASCDQIKAELATFESDKIPEKLADFGKAKYHPTSEESIRFARFVDVSKASKDKNCVASAKPMKKKHVTTASKTPVDPASKTVTKTVTNAASATAAKVMPVAKSPAAVQPADEGVTVQVPDSSG